MNVLILVAHPDDEIIMCGATISKLITKKDSVFVTFYTKNEQAYFGRETQERRVKRAVDEAKKAGNF